MSFYDGYTNYCCTKWRDPTELWRLEQEACIMNNMIGKYVNGRMTKIPFGNFDRANSYVDILNKRIHELSSSDASQSRKRKREYTYIPDASKQVRQNEYSDPYGYLEIEEVGALDELAQQCDNLRNQIKNNSNSGFSF